MIITDLETWCVDFHDEKIFCIERKRHGFTPFEEAEKFCDESTYETVSDSAKIVECIELPNSNVLLGFRDVWEEDIRNDDNDLIATDLLQSDFINYYLLSDIHLTDVTSKFK